MSKFPEIPGYRIKKKLGEGGMANVYLGVQENLSRMVAVKVLNMGIFSSPRLAKRFVKEAKTLSQLVHPHIVTIYDVGKVDRNYYIVMEYLQDSLKEVINKRRKIPPEESLPMVNQVADALFYAHENGIIHRDIKPDNILFRKDGTPVVLDFGIAKHLDSDTKLTRTGISVGTPQYMSPEQCNAERVDGRSDIYSLGVVLFEMLTGKPPYVSTTTMGVVMQHLHDPVPKLPENLTAYQPIIDKMMVKDRKRRLRSRNSLNNLIKELLNQNTERINTNQKETKSAVPRKPNAKSRAKTIDKTARTIAQVRKQPTRPSPETVVEEKEKRKYKKLVWTAASLVAGGILLLNWNYIVQFFAGVGEMFKSILDFLF